MTTIVAEPPLLALVHQCLSNFKNFVHKKRASLDQGPGAIGVDFAVLDKSCCTQEALHSAPVLLAPQRQRLPEVSGLMLRMSNMLEANPP